MGTVRQRRKQRSSLPKVRPKSKPKVTNPKSNPIIAENWDKKLTLAQNYKKLGLTSRLNAYTGGTEKNVLKVAGLNNIALDQPDSLAIVSTVSKTKIEPEEVLVERDPKTGAILRISDPSWKRDNPLNDPLNDISDEENTNTRHGKSTNFVQELEEQASLQAPKKVRPQSSSEQQWIQELVNKHGNDYKKMMLDKKLNIYQLSEGNIKSRIKKWTQATQATEAEQA